MEEIVLTAFASSYQAAPVVVANAPGRVNLIGEHIDYSGYGVFPMALHQRTVVAAGFSRNGDVQVRNVASVLYPDKTLPSDPNAPMLPQAWGTYVHAAYKGATEYIRLTCRESQLSQPSGLWLMVYSSVPPGAGLSSSSALVVGALLAILCTFNITLIDADTPQVDPTSSPQQRCITRSQLADLASRCERYVGTQGGGMDQAVSLLATEGAALHVEFDPLRAAAVKLPPGAAFVVANSLVQSHKAETASSRFNLRVVECKLAAMVLARHLGCSTEELCSINTLRDVEQLVATYQASHAADAPHQPAQASSPASEGEISSRAAGLVATVQQLLHAEPYSVQEVEQILGTSCQQLFAASPQQLQAILAASSSADSTGCFHLQQRAMHVYSEASRVLQFRAVCEDATLTANQKLTALGQLMDQSHSSCAQLYQCSCDELEQLVTVARGAGAVGARLTGAGWGGCIVALVHESQAEQFVSLLRERYYQPKVEAGLVVAEELGSCCFVSVPAGGAGVRRL